MATARECIKKVISENIGGRKLVSIEKFEKLEEFLAESKIVPEFHLTSDRKKIDGKHFFDISMIENKSAEYYVMISFQPDTILMKLMSAYGYELIKDFCYLQEMKKEVRGVENYHDGFNNVCNYAPENLKIVFAGTNAKVHLEKDVKMNGLVEIVMYDDTELFLGQESLVEGKFQLYEQAKCYIGAKCRGRFSYVNVFTKSVFKVGDYTTFTSRAIICVVNGRLEIGEDCMIAEQNTFWCGDSHAIYDVNSGKHINLSQDKNSILIKDHVWIGTRSIILSKTSIESGSIVGAGSVVKGNFPNNCIVAGNPVSMKKRDVFWCRDPFGLFTESEKKYYNKTVLDDTACLIKKENEGEK